MVSERHYPIVGLLSAPFVLFGLTLPSCDQAGGFCSDVCSIFAACAPCADAEAREERCNSSCEAGAATFTDPESDAFNACADCVLEGVDPDTCVELEDNANRCEALCGTELSEAASEKLEGVQDAFDGCDEPIAGGGGTGGPAPPG